jgi:hypothetical protein
MFVSLSGRIDVLCRRRVDAFKCVLNSWSGYHLEDIMLFISDALRLLLRSNSSESELPDSVMTYLKVRGGIIGWLHGDLG